MKTPTLAAALLFAAAAAVPAAALPDAPVPEAPFQVGPPPDARGDQPAPRFAPDCRDVVFQPEDPPVSKPVTLTSVAPEGGTDSMVVRLTLAERRPLNPWESDVFRACLTGPSLTVEPVSTAYDYQKTADGALDGNVILVSGAKRLLPPDPRGIQAVLTPGLTLAFYDLWPAYYPGGEVVLKMALMRAHSFWPDETVVEKEVALPVAQNYTVELSAAVHAPGEVYYARYSIRRLGGLVSTEAETPELQTEKVSYDRDMR
jgi:hypothetical protein